MPPVVSTVLARPWRVAPGQAVIAEGYIEMKTRMFALLTILALLVAACGGSTATSPAASESAAAYKACVAFDTGGLGDKGFNDLAKKGLDDAAAAGFDTAYAEAAGASDYEANIQRLIDEGCNSIAVVGFTQTGAAVAATKANPDVAFALIDGTWNPLGDDYTDGTADDNGAYPANFTGITFNVNESGMLAGYLAAGMSKTGKVCTYGGGQFPGVTYFMDGLDAGIAYYNEKNATAVKLLGWSAKDQKGTFINGDNPWGDPAKGAELAKSFYDQGCDVANPVSGSTGNGTYEFMMKKGAYSIGVDTDQALSLSQYAGTLLTSNQKGIDVAVFDTFKKNQGGDLGGEDVVGTLANGGVLISPYHDLDSVISAELKAGVDQLKADIIAGTVVVADYYK